MILDRIILHLCRFLLSLSVAVGVLMLYSIMIKDEFSQGIVFGICFWIVLNFAKKKILLEN